ncbi:hypothetical protein J5J86_08985 [Aquabacter sp. L1I39]|uniref:hypothetical protein n=1 Tax=Aquabacter sp. L1I39 TaxID=2820278 RepID=UPI001ADC0ED2|nr:hypothetical protein [Aquabacter sp. L1I39]QTL05397.1 hypothetical protein J5J86_08985 [Aquabacter sp. L1I39]
MRRCFADDQWAGITGARSYELIAAGEIFRQLDAFCRSNARVAALVKRRLIRAAARSAAAAAKAS